jgi:hypothetical protein
MLVEIAASQGAAVRALVSSIPELRLVSIERDHDGLDRVLVADRV